MKKILFIALLLGTMSMSAQTTYSKGADGKLVANTIKKETTPSVKTGDVVTIKNVDYPVYKTVKGKYYILKVSKTTGKEYKSYIKIG